MPELPEVETTRRGIMPHILHTEIQRIIVRQGQLRWPVPIEIQTIKDCRITQVLRRAKYLLLECKSMDGQAILGWMIIHLGMSGSLRLVEKDTAPEKHDHIDWQLSTGQVLRLRDPRRFGSVLWHTGTLPTQHRLLHKLGLEPLENPLFNTETLQAYFAGRKQAIKQSMMDQHLIVGVGNIYASESLFHARIHPERPSMSLSAAEISTWIIQIQAVLHAAIAAGGSTLRDFVGAKGQAGYFQQSYQVYGRTGAACFICQTPIVSIRLGQRNTFYCPNCQI